MMPGPSATRYLWIFRWRCAAQVVFGQGLQLLLEEGAPIESFRFRRRYSEFQAHIVKLSTIYILSTMIFIILLRKYA